MKGFYRFMDWPLRAKMAALLVVASLLPLGIETCVNIHEARERLLANTAALLAARGDHLADRIDIFHRGYVHSAGRISRLPNAAALCQARPEEIDRFKGGLLAILEVWPASDANIRGVAILDLSGTVRVATEEALDGLDLSYHLHVREALRGAIITSDIYLAESQVAFEPTIAYLDPVRGTDGKIAGTAVLWVRASALWDVMKASNELAGTGSFAVLFDRQGIRIGHTFSEDMIFHPAGRLDPATVEALVAERRFGEKTRALLEDVRPFPEQFDRARSEAPDRGLFRGFAPINQKWNYGVARRFEATPWTLFYMVPEQALNAQIAQMTREKILFAGVIVLIALAAATLFAAAILKPIDSLATATKSLADGHLAARVEAGHADELGRLGANFNSMAARIERQAAALQKGRDELELRVHERTAELAQTNQKLEVEITERQQAELTVTQLAAIVESSSDAIVGKDLHGFVTSWNGGAERIFGYTAVEMIGRSITLLIPPDRPDDEGQIQVRIRRGESAEHFETVQMRKDGSLVDVSVTVSPIKDATGKLTGASKVARDITERKRAEVALRESEVRLRLVLQAAQIGDWELDPVTRHAHCSPLQFQIFGYAEPFPKWSVERFVSHLHPEERKRVEGVMRDGLATQKDWRFECRVIRCDQVVRWIAVQARFFQDLGGHPWRVLGIVEDITERKETETALRESEQRLRFTLESCNIGAWDMDLVDHTAYRSVEHDRIFGYAEMLPEWTLDDFLRHALPEYRAEVEAMVRTATAALRGWTYECPIRRVDGEIRWIWFSGSHRTDLAGHSRVGGIVMDITERKRAEEAQRASEARYRALFDYAPDGILMADQQSYYLDANTSICRMLGYTRDELIGLHASNIVAPVEVPHIESALRVLTDKTDYHREWQFRRKGGSVFPAEVIATMMPDGNLMAMIRDVTERRNGERALHEKELQLHASDRRLAEIVHGMTEACFTLDREWHFTFVNDRSATLLRHHREQMLGRTIWETFRKLVGTPMEANYRRAMTDRVPVSFEVFSPIAERWLDIRLFPTPEGLAAFLLDIHARKQGEQAVAVSETRYRRLFESSKDGILILDADSGMVVDVNPFLIEMLGYSHDQFLGKAIWELGSFKDVVANEDNFTELKSKEYIRYENLPLETFDGYRIEVEFVSNVYLVNDRKVIQCNIRDVSERVKAAHALRETQARLNSALSAGSIGTWTWDIVNDRLAADEFTARMFSVEAEAAAKGLPAEAYLHAVMEEDQPGVADGLARAIQSCGNYDIEYRVRQKDGDLRWLQAKGRVEGDTTGKAVNFHGAVMDITERKRNEGRFRRLVDSNAQGVIFWNVKGEITQANDAFLRIVGYTREDLEAGRIGWAAMTPPEYAHLDQRSLEELAAKGICTPFEKEYIRKDSSRVPILLGAAIFEDSPDEGVCFLIDITERKQTERALRESEAHFRFLNDLAEATRALEDSAQIMAVMTRMLGEHLRASRCAYADVEKDGEQFTILHDYTDSCASTIGNYQLSLFGARGVAALHRGQTLVFRSVEAELLPPEGADMFNAIGIKATIICPVVKDGRLRAMMAVHQAGERDWKQGEIAMVQDVVERCWATLERRTAEGKIHQLNTELEQRVIQRTAQLEEANRELELADRHKSEFLANMSHELRTPLNGILGFTEFLVDEKPGPLNAKQKGYLNDVHNSAQHLLQLINDVLDVAKVAAGKIELNPETFLLSEAMEEICAVVRGIAQKKSVNVAWSVAPELGRVTLDPQKFKQICYNLLANAVKFSELGGHVTISAGAREGDWFEVRVKDAGIGIKKEDMQRLFREFEQLESGTGRRFEGTGLGLALTKKLVEVQGGSIGVESEYGTGSTFFAVLPTVVGKRKSNEPGTHSDRGQ